MHTRPDHVIVIMTDQQRADMCAREGFAVDCTPVVDALAARGCWFDHAYTSLPLCVPARISMLTGRHPSAHGVRENQLTAPRYTADLIDVMTSAGYRTALIGKNHSHLHAQRADRWIEYGHLGRRPESVGSHHAGFDAWLRELGFNPSMSAAPFPVRDEMPARIVEHVKAWLAENRGGRSFTWLSIPEPHNPYQVPEPYFSRYTPETVPPPATTADAVTGRSFQWDNLLERAQRRGEDEPAILLRARANYVAMIRLIDDQLSSLIDYLHAANLIDRTLLVIVSDHGDYAGDYGLLRKGGVLPEVLTRIPLVFNGAGIAPLGRSGAHVSIIDILPTLCELVGQPIPPGVQGRSLLGLLRGEEVPHREFASVYAEWGGGGLPYDASDLEESGGEQYAESGRRLPRTGTPDAVMQSGTYRMVREGRWKVVIDGQGQIELYDLDNDPYELTNLGDNPDHAAQAARMSALLASWLTRTADPLPVPIEGFRRKRHPRNYAWRDEPLPIRHAGTVGASVQDSGGVPWP